MNSFKIGVLVVIMLSLLVAGVGIASGQTSTPTVTVAKTANNPAKPDSPFWAMTKGTVIKTSGNPSAGGHGSIQSTPDILIKAAYTDSKLYMFFEWADPTNDNIYGYWKYDASQQKWVSSDAEEVNEDRLYLAWPTTDTPGRGGKTFAEAGCASICHAMDSKGTIASNQKAINDCGNCHQNATVKPADFTHKFNGACHSCHIDKSTFTQADMVAPEGGSYDLWHWKAGRAGNMGFADDQSTINGKKRGNDGSPGLDTDNINTEKNAPKYIWPLNSGNSASTGAYADVVKESILAQMVELSSDGKTVKATGSAVPNGTTVRSKILLDKTGHANNKHISSSHRYVDGKYQVVLTRKLNTGDAKDYQFNPGATNHFGVAVTDNGEVNHAGRSLVNLTFSTEPAVSSFQDVTNTHWAFKHIERLSGIGTINGFPGGIFKPEATVTRAEFAKMIIASIKENPKTTQSNTFSDTAGHWSASYIEKAAELGVIAGYPGGHFKPDNKVSRAEAVIMLSRAFNLKATTQHAHFKDVGSSHFAHAEILAALEHGLINGYPNDIFKPSGLLTRAEATKIISLAVKE